MQRVSQEERLLGGEEQVGAGSGRGAAVGACLAVAEEHGGAADGVGHARDEVGAVGSGIAGRLPREQRGERDRVHGRRRGRGAGRPREAEAVVSGGGPVADGNGQG